MSALFSVSIAILCNATMAASANETVTSLKQALKKSVLVFPFDVPSTVSGRDEVKMVLTDQSSGRLALAGTYAVTVYNKHLPTVARLHLDQSLTDSDVAEPYAEDNLKGPKIAKMTGFDVVMLGSVDDYQYNEAEKSVTVVVSGRLVDVKTGKFIATPVTLQGTSRKGSNAKEPALALEAARSAGDLLMSKLVPVVNTPIEVKPVQPVKTNAPRKKKNNDWVWGLLAIGLGIGIGLAGSGGHGGGGTDGPPAPP